MKITTEPKTIEPTVPMTTDDVILSLADVFVLRKADSVSFVIFRFFSVFSSFPLSFIRRSCLSEYEPNAFQLDRCLQVQRQFPEKKMYHMVFYRSFGYII